MIEVRLADGRVVQIDTDDPAVAAAAARRFMGVAATPAAPVSTPAPALLDTGGPGVTLGPSRSDQIVLRNDAVQRQIARPEFSPQQRGILLKEAADAAAILGNREVDDISAGERFRANFRGLSFGADDGITLNEAGTIGRAANTGQVELREAESFDGEADKILAFIESNPGIDPVERADLEALAVEYTERAQSSRSIGTRRSFANALKFVGEDARYAALPEAADVIGGEGVGGKISALFRGDVDLSALPDRLAAIGGGLAAGITSPTMFVGTGGANAVRLVPRIVQAATRSGTINAALNAGQGSVAQAERIINDRGQDEFSFAQLGLDAGIGAAFGGVLGGGGVAVANVARKITAAVGRRLNKPPEKVTAADIDSTVQLEFDNLVRDPEVAAFFEANNITRDNMRNIDPSMAAGRLDERRALEIERIEEADLSTDLPRSVSEEARAQRLRARGRQAPRAQPDDRGPAIRPDDVIEGGQQTPEGQTLVQARDSSDPGSEAGRQIAEVTDADRAVIEAEFGVVPRSLEQQARLLDVIRQREAKPEGEVIEGGRATEGGDQTAVAGRDSTDAGAEAGRARSEVTAADRQDILDNYGFVPESLEQQARMRDVLRGQGERQTAADTQAPLRSSDETGVTGEGRPVDPASRPNAPADRLTSGRAFEDQDAPVQRTDEELARPASEAQVRSASKAEDTGREVGARLDAARNTLDEVNGDPTLAALRRRRDAGGSLTNPEIRMLRDLEQSQARARKSVSDLEQQAADLSRRAGLGSRSESGISDRPHRGDDLVELKRQRDVRDSIGDTGSASRKDLDARIEQAEGFEAASRGRAEEARAKSEEDLLREWEARRAERDRVEAEAAREGRTHEDPDAGARAQYDGAARGSFSNRVPDPSDGGRYDVDDFGFVKSNKGTPVKFGTQKQAAKWIVTHGHVKSPDQIFEISNHPSGEGYTVKQRGIQDPPSGGRTDDGGGRTGDDADATPRQDADTGEPQQLSGPERQPADEPTPSSGADRGEAPAGPSPRSPEADAPAARTDEDAPAKTPDDDDDLGIPDFLRRGADDATARAETDTAPGPKLDTTDADAVAKRRSDLGKKFYASPLDPALFREVFDTFADVMGWTRSQIGSMLDGVIKASRTMTSSSNNVLQSFLDSTIRLAVYTNDGVLGTLQNRHNSAAIGRIRSMFFAAPGAGREAVGEDYHAAISARYQANVNRLGKILAPIVDTGNRALTKAGRAQKRSDLLQLGKLLRSGERITGTGKIPAAARAIRKMLDEERAWQIEAGMEVGHVTGFLPRELDVPNVLANADKFRTAAEKLYRTVGATAEEARELASRWIERIAGGDLGFSRERNSFINTNSASTGTRFEKHRKFGKEADTILADFYLQNPADILPRYFLQSARRAEWVRRMGPNLEKWNEIEAKMRGEGVPQSVIEEVISLIQSSTGTMRSPAGKARIVASTGRLWTILSYLSHATFTSLSEPTIAAIRTGNALDGLRAYQDTFHNWIPLLRNTRRITEAREFAEDLGVIGQVADDALMQERFGGNIDGRITKKISSRFFQITGLHQFTESTRVASLRIGQRFIRRLALDVADGRWRQRSARILLKELGVADDKIDSFAKWVKENDGNIGSELLKEGGMGEIYAVGLRRFIDQTIMRPNSSLRPKYAQHPLGQLVYALQSYLYAFHKNVIERLGKNVATAVTGKDLNIGDRARLMAPLGMMPITMITQFYLGKMRDAFNDLGRDEANKRELSTFQETMRAVSRSGFFGIPDTALNFVFSARFQKDPATVALGPLLGSLSELFSKGIGLFGERNSPNTNSAERSTMKAIYGLFVQPLLTGLLAATPGKVGLLTAPVFALEAAGAQAVSHPGARDAFADVTAGPKRTTGGSNRRGPPRRNRPNRPARQRMRN